jgi:hypothetical protein
MRWAFRCVLLGPCHVTMQCGKFFSMAMQAGGRVHGWVHGGCVMGSATSGSAACRCRYRYSHGGTDGYSQTGTGTDTDTDQTQTQTVHTQTVHTQTVQAYRAASPDTRGTSYPDTAYHDYDQPCVLSGTARLVTAGFWLCATATLIRSSPPFRVSLPRAVK